jgi:uncharacterized protein (TIGR03437 family)
MADQVLQRNGQASVFFDNCRAGRVGIEELGNAFRQFVDGLRYHDGQPVSQVDVVAHSMGGLIVRSYLAGKQPGGSFTPPPEVKIRKAVFIATPHFGSRLAELTPNDPNPQLAQLAAGSRFTYELATWNQGNDDLRGVDALAVIGDAGTIAGGRERFHDGVVSLTSASLGFALTDRTRVLPYCHTDSARSLCFDPSGNPLRFLAQIDSESHDTARILTSFLNGAQDWRRVGRAASDTPLLRSTGGVLAQWRTSEDVLIDTREASVTGQILQVLAGLVFGDQLPAGRTEISLGSPSQIATAAFPVPATTIRAGEIKTGPLISAVYPVFASIFPRAVAPGMFISIYGSELARSIVAAERQPYPTTLSGTQVRIGDMALPLHYVSPGQINAVLPETISGVIRLTVISPAGRHTQNLLVQPAVPTVHRAALNATTGVPITPQAPARAGDYVALYLTGLGATTSRDGLSWAAVMPEVTVSGQPCEIQYAGRAPGFIGLDQVNCRLPLNLAAGNAPVVIRSGSWTAAPVSVPVQ